MKVFDYFKKKENDYEKQKVVANLSIQSKPIYKHDIEDYFSKLEKAEGKQWVEDHKKVLEIIFKVLEVWK
ncbi:hypothetical protein M0R19_05180 [Candidatus Pacearchaeota archaeon]|jgi:hypothetical protein|nr:hypothetical protein [Candidatus Pacearchaeota archaeon]